MRAQREEQFEEKDGLKDVVIEIKRTSKKTKGGDRMGFTCLTVVGDQSGSVGLGLGKAPDVRASVKKAARTARQYMVAYPLVGEAKTIPHEIRIHNGACKLILKPAPAGTGIRAGGVVRSVLEVAGYANIVVKRIGTRNKKTNVDTILMALSQLKEVPERTYKVKIKKEKE